jgi:hypothetical protein
MEWREVVGYEGVYEVSDEGDVRRIGAACGATIGKILRPSVNQHGYLFLRLSKDGVSKNHSVHGIVARAFLGPRSLTVNHKDGNKQNPALSNLEYISLSANLKHAHAMGLIDQRGVKNPASRLTDDNVREIRKVYSEEKPYFSQLARRYGVSTVTIWNIVRRASWTHLEP